MIRDRQDLRWQVSGRLLIVMAMAGLLVSGILFSTQLLDLVQAFDFGLG